MLLGSSRWAQGFREAKQKHRLSLWKLKAMQGQEPSPAARNAGFSMVFLGFPWFREVFER